MESSMNSSCFSDAPTILIVEETKHKSSRMDEKQCTNKEIMRADIANATIFRPDVELQDETQPKRKPRRRGKALMHFNENGFGSIGERTQTLNQIMEALADPNTHIIGLHSSNENAIKVTATLPEKVRRRAERDNMFDVILKATVTKKPNIKKIQDEIANDLNLKMDGESVSRKASILQDCIKTKQKILVMLYEVYEGIDLEKVGISFGEDHSGCKILLTSPSEFVLSNQMHTQKNFIV